MNRFLFLLVFAFCTVFWGCTKPGDSTVSKAVTAFSSQNYDLALELFNQALNESTNYSDAIIYNFIANVYAAKEDFLTCAEYMEKSLELKPDYRGFVTLGATYQNLKNYDEAESNFKKAIELNPKKGEAFASLGILFLEEEKIDLAIENLEKGALLAPKIAVIHANLAVSYAKAGRIQDAQNSLNRAEELDCVNLGQFIQRVQESYNSKL